MKRSVLSILLGLCLSTSVSAMKLKLSFSNPSNQDCKVEITMPGMVSNTILSRFDLNATQKYVQDQYLEDFSGQKVKISLFCGEDDLFVETINEDYHAHSVNRYLNEMQQTQVYFTRALNPCDDTKCQYVLSYTVNNKPNQGVESA